MIASQTIAASSGSNLHLDQRPSRGRCYQFSVITNMFQTGTYTLIYGE